MESTIIPYTLDEVVTVTERAMKGFRIPQRSLARTLQTVITIAAEVGIPGPHTIDHQLGNFSRGSATPAEQRIEFLWQCVLDAHIETVEARAAGMATSRELIQPGEHLKYDPFPIGEEVEV